MAITRPLSAHTLALIEQARKREADRQAALASAGDVQKPEPALPAAAQPNNIVDASKLALSLSQTSTHAQSAAPGAMVFNTEQLAAIELGLQGKSFCLIGAAGTGKTTVVQELIGRLQRASHMRPLPASSKHLSALAPGIVICGYTNKAVNNIRKKLPTHLQSHCLTIHKLIEYSPVYYEVPDPESTTGGTKNTMRFEPMRNGANPLPHISTIIFEEASMIGTDLYREVIDALPNPSATQIIFLGDLNQIPPVFGPSILGFKLAELATVELTHVYRQALLSPIISLATQVRTNNGVPAKLNERTVIDNGEHGKVTLHPWKQRIEGDTAVLFMRKFLPMLITSGQYNPEEDMILCPFNVSFGTIELNKIIADFLGKRREAYVHEVIARYQSSYWAVGDRVLVDRNEAVITKIERTVGYYGKMPVDESLTLDRWGYDPESSTPHHEMTADEILNSLSGVSEGDEAKNLASHTITVYIPDLDVERRLNTAGDINSMLFGYALTIHKSQGSEWPRVFLFLHNTHASMTSRELVYTAITRAKQELYVICEGDWPKHKNQLARAAERPIIPGTTLADKLEFFKGKAASMSNGSSGAAPF